MTDVALLLEQIAPGVISTDDTFTVSLVGGYPLANIRFAPGLGLNVGPGLAGPVLDAVTLPISDLSTSLAIEHFNQFASIPLTTRSIGSTSVLPRKTPPTVRVWVGARPPTSPAQAS